MKLGIRELRRAARLTQDPLAAGAEITQSTISHVESGRHRPGLETLELIARALGVDVGEMFEGAETGDADVDGEDVRLSTEAFRRLDPAGRHAALTVVFRMAGSAAGGAVEVG